jgi:hypothetical protein
MGILNVDAYPLYWPETWPRTNRYRRKDARYEVTFAKARDEIVRELKLLGAREIVVSTNIPLRKDGLPYAGMSEPDDPGVAIYWVEREWKDGHEHTAHRVIACDHWRKVRENMRAANLAIAALRALKRTGATQVVEKAFTGFSALPNPDRKRTWRVVMGFRDTERPSRADIDQRFRTLAMDRHPDRGGTNNDMVELIAAREAALLDGLS